jgi:serine protease AprX
MITGAAAIKASAAQRVFGARGQGIVWAILDSGVQADHPHFRHHDNLGRDEIARLHKNFRTDEGDPVDSVAWEHDRALRDGLGHGTYIAGILGGALLPDATAADYAFYQGRFDVSGIHARNYEISRDVTPEELSGVAPEVGIISLRVLGDDGQGTVADAVRALRYIHEDLNGQGLLKRVHGVLIAGLYNYDRDVFRCGQSPLCREVDQLARSGVIVVVPAGNDGASVTAATTGVLSMTGRSVSIGDPGNAESALTVGSTTLSPHRDGVSYFSSKGPTEDGRLKPDVVAPGELVIGPAVGKRIEKLRQMDSPPNSAAVYVEDNGTSGAAALVAGAIASFLSVHREFIGRPEEVKRIFMDTATTLGRAPEFQGKGVIDVMRALQSV